MLVVILGADLDDFGEEFVAIVSSLGPVHVDHQLLDALHEVLLGHHSVDEIQSPQPNRLVLVVQTIQNQILVSL